jgi:PAS domain S-box-containing protein
MEPAIVMIDQQGTVVYWNDIAEQSFGHSRDDAVGRNVEFLVPDEYLDGHRAGLERAMSGGERHLEGAATHLPVRHADGRVITHSARFNHISDPSGVLVAAVATFGPATPSTEPWTPVS